MKIEECRSCNSKKLKDIISLGEQYVSAFVRDGEDQKNVPKVPLDLVLCERCNLLQLRHNAPNESMWNDRYGYKSGINRLIKEDLKDILEKSRSLVELYKGDIVVDIGCNDGTMLNFYDKRDELNLVGFEPSGNVAREAEEKGFNIINNFFNADDYREKFGGKKAKIITAISMFYDLENPNKFLEDVKSCLDKNGLLTIQQNYVVTMLEQNAFDNICHEHREFYSLNSLENLLNRHALEVFDVKLNNINGGSLRTYVKYNDSKIKGFEGAGKRLSDIRKKEAKLQLNTPQPYQEFASRIDSNKKQIIDFLKQEKSKGKTIGLCGASTRGNTALQYFGITPDLVIAASEANPDKWGKKTVGTLIPIVSIEEMEKINPDYQLVMIWHLFEGLRNKEKDFMKKGGKFILPLPEFKVVGN